MKDPGFARTPARPTEELAQIALLATAWLLLAILGAAFL